MFGSLAGIIGGATNAMSPILMMYLFSETDTKHKIVKVSNICYFLGKIVQIFLLSDEVLAFNTGELLVLIAITLISVLFCI